MRKWIVGLVAVLAVACASPTRVEIEGGDWDIDYREIALPDGRTIPCIIYNSIEKGGISCDWGER